MLLLEINSSTGKKFSEGIKDFTVDKDACHQYATLPNVNFSNMPARNIYNSLNKQTSSKKNYNHVQIPSP